MKKLMLLGLSIMAFSAVQADESEIKETEATPAVQKTTETAAVDDEKEECGCTH